MRAIRVFSMPLEPRPDEAVLRSHFTLNYSTQLDKGRSPFRARSCSTKRSITVDHVRPRQADRNPDPRFKLAWTEKLCAWANSGACLESDPELVRIANVFANSDYDWTALVRELFTSPLVTYTSRTATTDKNGAPVAIARRAQLCATIGNRLGLADVCGLKQLQVGSCATDCPPRGNTVPSTATNLPSDGYSRGAVSALYVNDPDPFYPKLGRHLAPWWRTRSSTSWTARRSIRARIRRKPSATSFTVFLVRSSRDAAVQSVLGDHFDAAKAAGKTPTVALKSAFVLACISPYIVSIGQ